MGQRGLEGILALLPPGHVTGVVPAPLWPVFSSAVRNYATTYKDADTLVLRTAMRRTSNNVRKTFSPVWHKELGGETGAALPALLPSE